MSFAVSYGRAKGGPSRARFSLSGGKRALLGSTIGRGLYVQPERPHFLGILAIATTFLGISPRYSQVALFKTLGGPEI